MMHVHYNASETGILQLKDDTFEQRFSPDTYQSLRNAVGKWLKASAKPAANIIACIIAK